MEIEQSYKYFSNKKCKYYPCHKTNDTLNFNCLFCFCPLYNKKCNGNYTLLNNGIKDCSKCLIPHKSENYEDIISQLVVRS